VSVEPAESEPTELLVQARRLIDLATERELVLRLIGGLAIALLTPELPARTRTGQDLDFASVRSSRKGLSALLEQEGFVGDRNFNALYGDKQLYFTHPETGLAIDVMVDRIHMCHTVEFADRATALPYTLSPTDLLLSKLQIVELNAKDLDDVLRLLVHFPLAEGDGGDHIDLGVIAALVGDDWGWFRTISLNLDRIEATIADGRPGSIPAGAHDPAAAVQTMRATLDAAPRSRRWRLRARVGERKRWYDLPEETAHH
jgi:hypothetical protein